MHNRGSRVAGLTAALMLMMGSKVAGATDIYLRAMAYEQVMYDGQSVPMWGFASCDPTFTTCDSPSSPGPQIDVAAGDPLNIYVDNQLPAPVSIMIPGQGDAGDPVYFTDALGRQRVRSFTHEVAAGSSGVYTFAAMNAGTYLYESGTYPSIQVPMGLFGAVVVGPGAGVCLDTAEEAAYASEDSCYDSDAVLIFSEVDSFQNQAVAAASSVSEYPVTVDYHPDYFLVNGGNASTLPALAQGDTLLLRMINVGQESHYPELAGASLTLLAQDGYPLPGAARLVNIPELAAGSTLDALVAAPSADVTLGLFDRGARSNFSAASAAGASVSVVVGTGTPADPTPTSYAVADSYAVSEDSSLLASSVLDNDVGLAGATVTVVIAPAHGTLTMAADGTFTYSPDADFSGEDAFVYVANLAGEAFPATATLTVDFANDAPVAADDGTYTNTMGPDISVAAPGVLGNDRDVDGDPLSAVLVDPPASGSVTLNADGSFDFTGGIAGDVVTFTYMAYDGTEYSDVVTVTLELLPVAGIALAVADKNGTAVTDYYWTVQEDRTYKVDPANPASFLDSQVANFHKSYMPVIATGTSRAVGGDDFAQLALDPEKTYYVSVLPLDGGNEDGTGHGMSGAPIAPGDTAVSVQVASHPIPTAQLSVFVFEDLSPINGAPDGDETGLGGYQITLEDAGGRYGANGGTMSQDVFGNPLKNSLDCFGGAEPPKGVILSCPDGTVLIKNLAPGKYGVSATPPSGVADTMVQTSTIEGTRITDAWVQADEAPFMSEWGPGPHVFVGFVNTSHAVVPSTIAAADRVNTVTGNVTLYHDPRPPAPFGSVETGNYDGLSFTQAWVGLNSLSGGGQSYAAVQADTEGNFTIEGIPNGDYQLVVWDTYLDQIIQYQSVTLSGAGADLGHVPVFAWFSRLEHNVFLDANQNGVRDEGEAGLPDQNVNVRFRDGSIFQSYPTDTEGFVPFDQIFPFFSWQVAEVDFARLKPTGLTVTVDGGGDTTGSPYPGILSVQGGAPRTETGPVLTEAFQQFAGQTTIMDWGKAPYSPGENGGIAGIVYYASTRAEFNPRLGAGDPWERGLPGVTVRLYQEVATAGSTSYMLVDEVTTDNWDDSLPTDCPGEDASSDFVTTNLTTAELTRCFDGWRNYNQSRPGIFDGGYAFTGIPAGDYVVEVIPPVGFEIVKEEDVNITYGDVFDMAAVSVVLPGGATVVVVPDMATVIDSAAEPGLAQPACIGEDRVVPEVLALFPDAMTLSPYAGYERPLCDRKAVHLPDQGQAAADFFLFTPAPIATQFTGLVLDDIAMEQDPASPNFSEKFAPPYLPVSIRDWQGNEVYHTYSDGFGRYNGMAASTYNANIPNPSGYSPAMYSVCLNSAGDAAHPEPYRNENYGEICYTLQFMPGTTTYADTPILPNSAFSAGFNPVDCAQPTGTPQIDTVSKVVAKAGDTVTISSLGTVSVANPDWRGPSSTSPYNQPFVTRNFGFGTNKGKILLDAAGVTVASWTDAEVSFKVPRSLAAGTYQLSVVNKDGVATQRGVTFTVTTASPIVVTAGQSIQDAIDAAPSGSLIQVGPGTYEESLVLWKPVQLQGSGAGSTIIEAAPRHGADTQAWREKVAGLVDAGLVDTLPGQTATLATAFGAGVFDNEMGAAVFVLANEGDWAGTASRIDGFTIRDGVVGGGVVVNGYADDLDISNNIITRNQGWLGGGVRVGDPILQVSGSGPYDWNPNIHIHHNDISLNGATGETAAGGGVTLANGTDNYEVTSNFICGNYTAGDGAGISHVGLSDNGTIAGNTILFNQAANPSLTHSGGGIFLGGQPTDGGGLTEGTGDVLIDRNTIRGNIAAAGHGGGIRAEYVNGKDVEASAASADWYGLTITNNIIVNNIANWAGGGISLQDVVKSSILHDTIANNDSTATVGPLIDFATNSSEPQPAGVSSSLHSAELYAALPAGSANYANPTMIYNILWHNRSFHYDASSGAVVLVPQLSPTTDGECATGASYWDMGVLGSTQTLTTINSIMTVKVGSTNKSNDPVFAAPYCNTGRETGSAGPIELAAATDEAGNAIAVRYGPLTPNGKDYHLGAGSAANNYQPVGPATGVTVDVDNQSRPRGPRVDAGADER